MVNVNELPIQGKMKLKFEEYFKKHPLDTIVLGDFGKWESHDKCAVCGHSLIWSYINAVGTQIGGCCASNIIALQRCEGNYDELNFKRQLELTKRTIAKNQAEWNRKQKGLEMEIKYNDEYKYCKEVVDKVLSDNFYVEHRRVSNDQDPRTIESGRFFYAGVSAEGMKEIYQCKNFLEYLKMGIVNEFYLGKLRELMKTKSPETLINDSHHKIKKEVEQRESDDEKRKLEVEAYEKVNELRNKNLNLFQKGFIDSVYEFFNTKNYYSPKQIKIINKIYDEVTK